MELNEKTIHQAPDGTIANELPCYGILWDPKDMACAQECIAFSRCLYRMAKSTIPQIAGEAGHTNPNHHTGELGTNPDALTYTEWAQANDGSPQHAFDYANEIRRTPDMGLPVIQPDGRLTGSNKWGHPMPYQAGQVGKAEGEEVLQELQKGQDVSGDVEVGEIDPETGKMIEKKNAIGEGSVGDELSSSSQATIEQALNELGANEEDLVVIGQPDEEEPPAPKPRRKKKVTKKTAAKKTTRKKATTKKKTTRKKATSKKKAVTKKAPTKKATSRKKPPAPAKKANGVTANPQKASAPQTKRSGSWGQHTHASRFSTDLQKNPEYNELPWGTTLEKSYQGRTHKVQITQEGWKYNGKLYPTLYEVMCVIKTPKQYPGQLKEDGTRLPPRTMSSMSAKRFFKLESRRR